MGFEDHDDPYRSRGQAPRRRDPRDGGPPDRSSGRNPRDGAPRGRGGDPYERSGEYARERGPAPRGYDDDPRSSRRDYDRGDRYDRGDSPRGGARGGYAPDGPRRPRRDDDRGGRDASSERSAYRGGRPAPRGDDWDSPTRSRRPMAADASGARRPAAAAAAGRAGLWGDAPATGYGARAGASAASIQGLRRGMAAQPEEEETSSGMGAGKAFGVIVLALALGVGAAFGYYKFSTPKPPANPAPAATTAPGAFVLPGQASHANQLVVLHVGGRL